ncbi:MAG: L,D-transpeptidase [Candidatus Levybacteria bacterium]|nr:L,D-transpeptidase [Candidatus Levybacteria bacterium]
MVKKLKKKVITRKKSTRTKGPVGFFYFRRFVIISVLAALFFTGVVAITQTQAWFYFYTGKEQFIPNDPSKTVGYFHGKEVSVPTTLVSYDMQQEKKVVLGDTSNKRIEVDLTNQRVYAFENGNKVYDFLVSTGKWGRTPVGEFTVHRRVPVQAMTGGSKALGTYYYLPGVKYVQFFGNSQIPWWRGYSFHSTYWHNNFGHPMSHGCINMTFADAETLWNWSGDTGTKVVIYGTTPAS